MCICQQGLTAKAAPLLYSLGGFASPEQQALRPLELGVREDSGQSQRSQPLELGENALGRVGRRLLRQGLHLSDAQTELFERQIPVGINVESVSIRKEEIDAATALFTRLRARLGR